VEALSGGSNTRRRFWLIPAIFVLSAAAVLAALVTVISNRHSRKDTLQLKAEVAQLNGGILQQGELLRRAEQARASLTASDAPGTRESLKAQTKEIRKRWQRTATQIANPSRSSFRRRRIPEPA